MKLNASSASRVNLVEYQAQVPRYFQAVNNNNFIVYVRRQELGIFVV